MIERDGRQLRDTRGELLAVATNEESAALLVNTYSDLYEALKDMWDAAWQAFGDIYGDSCHIGDDDHSEYANAIRAFCEANEKTKDALKKAEERL